MLGVSALAANPLGSSSGAAPNSIYASIDEVVAGVDAESALKSAQASQSNTSTAGNTSDAKIGLFVDENTIANSGVAVASTSNSLTLDNSASSTTDFYTGKLLTIVGGYGAGQSRNIVSSRENLVPYSNYFGDWVKQSITTPPIANYSIAPSGKKTATLITFYASTGSQIYKKIPTLFGGVFTISVKHKSSGIPKTFRLTVYNSIDGPQYSANFTTSNNWEVASFTPPIQTTVGTNVYITNGLDGVAGSMLVDTYQAESGYAATEHILTYSTASVGVKIDSRWSENRVINSNNFSIAPWDHLNCTFASNVTTAPDGTMTAGHIASNAITGRIAMRQFVDSIAYVNYSASVYLKAAAWSNAVLFIDQINVVEGAYYGNDVKLDLATGVSSNPNIVSLVSVGSGWYRANIIATPTSPLFFMEICPLNPGNNANVNAIIGDGVSGIYICNAQLETGSVANTYIPTSESSLLQPNETSSYLISSCNDLILAGNDAAVNLTEAVAGSDSIAAASLFAASNFEAVSSSGNQGATSSNAALLAELSASSDSSIAVAQFGVVGVENSPGIDNNIASKSSFNLSLEAGTANSSQSNTAILIAADSGAVFGVDTLNATTVATKNSSEIVAPTESGLVTIFTSVTSVESGSSLTNQSSSGVLFASSSNANTSLEQQLVASQLMGSASEIVASSDSSIADKITAAMQSASASASEVITVTAIMGSSASETAAAISLQLANFMANKSALESALAAEQSSNGAIFSLGTIEPAAVSAIQSSLNAYHTSDVEGIAALDSSSVYATFVSISGEAGIASDSTQALAQLYAAQISSAAAVDVVSWIVIIDQLGQLVLIMISVDQLTPIVAYADIATPVMIDSGVTQILRHTDAVTRVLK